MSGLKTICFFILFGIISFSLCAAGKVLAEIDGVPLTEETLSKEAKALLPDDSLPADIYEVKLRSAVMTELKIRETLSILKQENIECGRDIAMWYIAERQKKYASNGSILVEGLRKMVANRSFQLKCAVYRYLNITQPDSLVLVPGEAEKFYFRNQLQYKVDDPGVYKVVSVPAGTDKAAEKAAEIRLALLQGESPESAASRFGADCVVSSPAAARKFSRYKLRENAVSEVVMQGTDSACVAVCITSPRSGFIPFSQLEPLIEEELISRRAGAVFDKILQKRLSQKSIKYRR